MEGGRERGDRGKEGVRERERGDEGEERCTCMLNFYTPSKARQQN